MKYKKAIPQKRRTINTLMDKNIKKAGFFSCLKKKNRVKSPISSQSAFVLWALLLSVLEYQSVIWYQLDLPMYIYERDCDLSGILYRLTQTNNPCFQFIAIAVLYQLNRFFVRKGIHLLQKNDWIISPLFSCIFVVGYSYDQLDSLELISWNSILLVTSAASILGYTLLCLVLTSALRGYWKQASVRQTALPHLWDKHPFLFPMMILFICWLPYAVVRYPAGMEFDAFYQIQQVLAGPLRTNNPLLSTLFFGYGFTLGQYLFHSINAGLFFVVICQMLLCAAADAYAMLVLKKKNVSSQMMLGVLLVYALSPFIAQYTTSIVKDALYSHSVLFLVTALVDITGCDVVKNRKKLVILAVAALSVCFLRNNGIIVVCASAAAYFFVWAFRQRNTYNFLILCGMVLPLCLYLLFSNVIIPGLGIQKWRTSEILSVPFQQTARFIVSREDLITEEEKEIIDAVLDYEKVKANYNPRLSDPVKSTYRGDEAALQVYLKYWFGELLEYPVEYLSATFNNCYGFFYPEATEDESASGIYLHSNWDPELLAVNYNELQQFMVRHFSTVIRFLESLPIFYPLCNVAIHVWVFLWMFTSKLRNNIKSNRTAMVPVLASVITLVFMPTYSWNGFRYALPVVIAVPFLLCLFIDSQMENEQQI